MQANRENWRAVSEWDNYEVSDHGRVRNVTTAKILNGTINSRGYKVVKLYQDGTMQSSKVHRLVAQEFLENPDGKMCVDHIDGNRTNNLLANLRWATTAENQQNSKKRDGGTSKYKGVALKKATGRWYARIQKDGRQTCLGTFDSEEEAALVYNEAAEEMFGAFAKLNVIE